MAAVRSALATLTRRSGGSSAATPIGGGGLELHRVFRSAVPRTPPLRSAAVRNHESWRCMSTGAGDSTVKAARILRLWWQRAKDRVKNADEDEKNRAFFVYALVTVVTPSYYVVRSAIDIYQSRFNKS